MRELKIVKQILVYSQGIVMAQKLLKGYYLWSTGGFNRSQSNVQCGTGRIDILVTKY